MRRKIGMCTKMGKKVEDQDLLGQMEIKRSVLDM
jgi:hypothetical protein